MSRQLVYTGVLSGTLKRLKILSLASCGAALTGTPVLFALESSVSAGGRIALGSVVVLSSIGSTALIHFFTRPYIHKLYQYGAEFLSFNIKKFQRLNLTNCSFCVSFLGGVKCFRCSSPKGTKSNQQELVAETLSILARTQSVPFRLDQVCVFDMQCYTCTLYICMYIYICLVYIFFGISNHSRLMYTEAHALLYLLPHLMVHHCIVNANCYQMNWKRN